MQANQLNQPSPIIPETNQTNPATSSQPDTMDQQAHLIASVLNESLSIQTIVSHCTLQSATCLAACSKALKGAVDRELQAVAPQLFTDLSGADDRSRKNARHLRINDPDAPSKLAVFTQTQQRSHQRGRMDTPSASAGTDIDALRVPMPSQTNNPLQRLRNLGL